MNIFVGNLSFSSNDNDVKILFEKFGTVLKVSIKKKSGNNSRGFGFVTMPDDAQAQAAIEGLQNKEFMGRALNVSMERPKAVKHKKDYKEIKRIQLESKNDHSEFIAPEIPEKNEKLPKRVWKENKRSSKPSGSKVWEKRKGRGTSKPWKKKPGGVNKKFKHAR